MVFQFTSFIRININMVLISIEIDTDNIVINMVPINIVTFIRPASSVPPDFLRKLAEAEELVSRCFHLILAITLTFHFI